MDNIETIFLKDDFKLSVVFETNDFKSEVNKFINKYIDELEAYKVDDCVVKRKKNFADHVHICYPIILKAFIQTLLTILKKL